MFCDDSHCSTRSLFLCSPKPWLTHGAKGCWDVTLDISQLGVRVGEKREGEGRGSEKRRGRGDGEIGRARHGGRAREKYRTKHGRDREGQ